MANDIEFRIPLTYPCVFLEHLFFPLVSRKKDNIRLMLNFNHNHIEYFATANEHVTANTLSCSESSHIFPFLASCIQSDAICVVSFISEDKESEIES